MARILVIDDEKKIRQVLRTYIEAEGHEVLEAGDSAEADAALEKRPDAVFIDVAMPGETGAQFLLRLRQHPSLGRTPAMFVTAHGDRILPIQKAGLAGPHVVHKPFRRDDIRRALRAMLRSRRRRVDARLRILREAIHITLDDEPRVVAKNVSIGGVFVHTRRKRPIGAHTEITIQYRKMALKTRARVTHTGVDGVGFAFVEPSLGFLRSLAAAIDHLLSIGTKVDDRRVAIRYRVSAAIAFSDGKERRKAQLQDLSATGAFIRSQHPPVVGSEVYIYLPGLTFSGGGDASYEIRGCLCEVARQDPDGFGVRFCDPSAEFQMAADALMTRDGRETLVGM